VLSLGVFALFVLVGDPVLKNVFQVRLGSLQVFGGLINLFIAYRYITVGPGSNLLFRGNISDLAPTISLPYMVGPGTIWLSILIGRAYQWPLAIGLVSGVLAINMLFVLAAMLSFTHLKAQSETLLGKYFSILMRTMALFIGAIGVEMIFSGIEQALINRPTGEGTESLFQRLSGG
jgi:multiple antibiotic resistance protein